MELAIPALVALGAVVAWLVAAALLALVAGRVIHERDVHDRPSSRLERRSRSALLHR